MQAPLSPARNDIQGLPSDFNGSHGKHSNMVLIHTHLECRRATRDSCDCKQAQRPVLTNDPAKAYHIRKAKTGKQTRPFARMLGDETVNVTSQANQQQARVASTAATPCMHEAKAHVASTQQPPSAKSYGNVKIQGKRAARTRAARRTRLQADTARSARGERPTAARSYNNSGDRLNSYRRLTTIGNRDTPPACVGTPKASLATHCRAHRYAKTPNPRA